MQVIRPELRAAAWRGREMLLGAGLALLGLWGGGASFGLTRWLAYGLAALGLTLIWTGWQRWRLRPDATSLGVIEVDEARITYWGPLTGGAVGRDSLTRLSLDPTARPAHWVLAHEEGPDLHIPVSADGQDGLFDALSALPGLSPGALVAAHGLREGPVRLVWQRVGAIDSAAGSPHQ